MDKLSSKNFYVEYCYVSEVWYLYIIVDSDPLYNSFLSEKKRKHLKVLGQR